jgi:transposase
MRKGKIGRPAKLTIAPELQKFLVDAVAAGCPISQACEAAGVSVSSFSLWVAKGDKPGADRHYVEFSRAIKKAKRTRLLDALQTIQAAGQRQWQAQAWWLERSDPERWGPPQTQLMAQEILKEMKLLSSELKARGMPCPFNQEVEEDDAT